MARAIYKIIQGDKYKEIGYMRGDPKEHKIKLLVRQLKNLGVQIHNYNHQMIIAKNNVKVDVTGIVLQQ